MDKHAHAHKTAKGEEEIQRRTHGLDRNLRYVLILVDGHSTVEQIEAKGAGLPDVPGALEQLAAQGFITLDGAAGGASAAGGKRDVAGVKAELIGIARELLGADAGKVIGKLEAAPDTKEGLLEVTSQCKKVIRLTIDEVKAEQLMNRCAALLDEL